MTDPASIASYIAILVSVGSLAKILLSDRDRRITALEAQQKAIEDRLREVELLEQKADGRVNMIAEIMQRVEKKIEDEA